MWLLTLKGEQKLYSKSESINNAFFKIYSFEHFTLFMHGSLKQSSYLKPTKLLQLHTPMVHVVSWAPM